MSGGAPLSLWLDDGTNLYPKNTRGVDLNDQGMIDTGFIDFDLVNTVVGQEGRLYWDSDDGTLELGMPGGNVNLQIGQEVLLPRAKNVEGTQIDNGEVVYVSGGSGANPEVQLADASVEAEALATIAIATENVADQQLGYFTTLGLVRDIDTSSWAAGTELYLDSTPGALTSTPPASPATRVTVGRVVRQHATEGVIYVHIDVRPNLAQVLSYDNITGGTDLVLTSGDSITSTQTGITSTNGVIDLDVTASASNVSGINVNMVSTGDYDSVTGGLFDITSGGMSGAPGFLAYGTRVKMTDNASDAGGTIIAGNAVSSKAVNTGAATWYGNIVVFKDVGLPGLAVNLDTTGGSILYGGFSNMVNGGTAQGVNVEVGASVVASPYIAAARLSVSPDVAGMTDVYGIEIKNTGAFEATAGINISDGFGSSITTSAGNVGITLLADEFVNIDAQTNTQTQADGAFSIDYLTDTALTRAVRVNATADQDVGITGIELNMGNNNALGAGVDIYGYTQGWSGIAGDTNYTYRGYFANASDNGGTGNLNNFDGQITASGAGTIKSFVGAATMNGTGSVYGADLTAYQDGGTGDAIGIKVTAQNASVAAGNVIGGDFYIEPTVAGSTIYGLRVSNQGSEAGAALLKSIGTFTTGIDLSSSTLTTSFLTTSGPMYMRGDGLKSYWGAGNDASISYDGTDLLIRPDEVGTGAVRIYSDSADDVLKVERDGGDSQIAITAGVSTATDKPRVLFRHSRGTIASPTASQSGDDLGNFAFQSYTGATYSGAATIVAKLVGSTGGDLLFYTRPDGGAQDSVFEVKSTGDIYIPNDSKKLYFGAGQDAYLEYDGTDMKILTDAVAASDLVVDCGTDKTIELAETVWEDMRIPGLAVRLGATSPDLVAFLGSGGLKAYAFDGGSTTEEVHFTVQLPHSYKQGTDIIPHVHWSPTTSAAGNVKWQLEYTWVNVDGTFGASTTISGTDSTDSTAWKHLIAGLSTITGTSKNISSMLVCRLFRDPSDAADTYGADASLLEIDFHFEIDTIGSRQTLIK